MKILRKSTLLKWPVHGDDTPPPPPPKTFTQEDVNAFLAKEKKKYQETQQKLLDDLKAIQVKADLTKEERDDLEKRIESIQNESMSKEELAKREREKIIKEHTDKIEKLTSENKKWESRFRETVITADLTAAAAEGKAFSPEQVIALLRPTTNLVEDLDSEGKPSGKFKTVIKFSDVDSKGKPVVLDLSPNDAIKRMREIEKFQNLFIAEGEGGFGGGNKSSGKVKDPRNIAKNPEEYRKWRKEQGY